MTMRGAYIIVVVTIACQMSYWVLAQPNHTKGMKETSSNITANSTFSNKTNVMASNDLPVHNDSAKGSQGSTEKSTVIPKQDGTKDKMGAVSHRVMDLAQKKMSTSQKMKENEKMEKEFVKTGCLLDEHDIDELFAKLHSRGYKYKSPAELSFRSASHYKPPSHLNVYPVKPRSYIPTGPNYSPYDVTGSLDAQDYEDDAGHFFYPYPYDG